MKKILFSLACCSFVITSCTKSSFEDERFEADSMYAAPVARSCAAQDVLVQNLQEDPTLAGRMQAIEAAIDIYEKNPSASRLLSNGMIEIPVVVNVIYNTTAENVSDALIASQIQILNNDFAGTNSDISSVPATFTSVKAGDVGVRFVLQAVNRLYSKKTSWRTDDAMKKSSRGGINPTDPSSVLNFWVCDMSGGILGYAQFPGGNPATDGVVIHYPAFGNTSYAPYNKGRTATHEVGHWLNLRHIWGDATCGNDQVGDTPLHNSANYGCPASGIRSTCSGSPVMMTMNYMDYTDDLCMYMFSAGQKTRINATFASGGGRTGFAQ